MLRFIGFLFLLFVALAVYGGMSTKGSSTSSGSGTSAMTDAQCRQDIQCYADKFKGYATVACQDPVERRAKNNFEWTDKWYESKFDRRKWADKSRGTITYVGDHIKFQNGFGAWSYMKYGCTYDTEARQVVDVFVAEGRYDN